MNKVATGMIIGGIVGLAGAEYFMMSETAKKRAIRKGKKLMNKAEDMLDDMSTDIW